jgi:hypothetical protein
VRARRIALPIADEFVWCGGWLERDCLRRGGDGGQSLSGGDKIPAGNEKWIPAGDGDPFSLKGGKDPRQERKMDLLVVRILFH